MIYPGSYDLVVIQDGTFDQDFNLINPDGTPVDLTGSSLEAYVIKGNSGKVAITPTWVDRPNGKFNLSLTATQTKGIKSNGKWFLFVINPDSSRDCWLTGSLSFLATQP